MVISIDPGISGAIAHLDESGALLSVQDMPVLVLLCHKRNRVAGRRGVD